MAMTGRFDANFESFYGAVEKAVVELKGFDAATGQVESSLSRMVDQFSGRQVITQATLMTEAVEKVGGVSKLTASELEHVGAVASEAAEKLRAWGQDVPANIQKYADAANVAKDSTEGWGATMSTMSGVLGAFGIQFSAQALIGGMISFAKETAAAAEELQKLHDRTGINVESLQRFQQAGEASGNSIEQISSAALSLSERLATGNKSTVGALEQLGIKLEEFRNLSIEDRFLAVADAIKQIPDPTDQVTAALELMGQKGVAVIPTLKSDIEGLGNSIHVMSQQSVQDWAMLSQAIKDVATTSKNYMGEYVTSLDTPIGKLTFLANLIKATFGGTNQQIAAMTAELQKGSDAFGALVPPKVPEDLKNIELDLENVTNAQIRDRKEAELWGKTMSQIHDETFKLQQERWKKEEEEKKKQTAAINKTIVDGLNETTAAQQKYYDYLDKTTMDSTDYQIKKIWEKVAAEEAAFKGTVQQRAAYVAAVEALADAETAAITEKAQKSSKEITALTQEDQRVQIAAISQTTSAYLTSLDAMVNAAGKAAADIAGAFQQITVGHRPGEPGSELFAGSDLPNQGAPLSKLTAGGSGGTLFGGGGAFASSPEAQLAGFAAAQARYPGQVINSSPLFAGQMGLTAPQYYTTINVTQPLGTPDAIARAVGDAQMNVLKGQGVRLPYGT